MTTKDEALKRIAAWNEHPVSLAVDHGSNGVRDYYRQIAQDALAESEKDAVMTDKKDEALKRIMEAHKFNVATLRPREVHAIAYEALAEQEQDSEPVAWGIVASNTGRICQVEFDRNEVSEHNQKYIVPLYTTPQPAPAVQEVWEELSAWWDSGDENFPNLKRIVMNMLTTAPQAPAVQPLTDEQIKRMWVRYAPEIGAPLMFARAVEAAHGISAPKEDV